MSVLSKIEIFKSMNRPMAEKMLAFYVDYHDEWGIDLEHYQGQIPGVNLKYMEITRLYVENDHFGGAIVYADLRMQRRDKKVQTNKAYVSYKDGKAGKR